MNKKIVAIAVPISYVALWQFSYFFRLDDILVACIALFPILFLGRSDFKSGKNIFLSAAYSLIFIILLIEPGVFYGKLQFQALTFNFVHTVIFAILFTISLISVIHGIIMHMLWKHPFRSMAITSLVYIFSITPITSLLDSGTIVQTILFNISFIVVLCFYLGFLYLKSDLNTLSGIVFLSIYSIFTSLGISVLVSRLFNLVWEVIAISVVLFITDMTISEPVKIKRLFKSKIKVKKKESSALVLVAGLLIILLFLVVLPAVTHESHYAIADPTDSMYPVIKPGSLLFISQINPQNVSNGTIILFNAPWENGTLIAHQVIGIYYQNGVKYFITKGVNNPSKDPLPVPSKDLVGRVYYSLPYLGYLLIYSKIIAAITLVVIGSLFAIETKR